jgi:hypothetical protein
VPHLQGVGSATLTVIITRALTGGFNLILGASGTKGKITVTWVRGGEPKTKVCPQCAEEVKAAAKVYRFCQYQFES